MANLKYNIGAVGIANGSVDFLVDTIEVLFTKSTYTLRSLFQLPQQFNRGRCRVLHSW